MNVKVTLMALSVVCLLGSGCYKSPSGITEGKAIGILAPSEQKNDYFNKKQECAKYKKQLEQEGEKADPTPFSVKILGSVCYSKEENTCIAYVEEAFFDKDRNEKSAILSVKDVLTGTDIESVSYFMSGQETEDEIINKRLEYSKNAGLLHDKYPCVN